MILPHPHPNPHPPKQALLWLVARVRGDFEIELCWGMLGCHWHWDVSRIDRTPRRCLHKLCGRCRFEPAHLLFIIYMITWSVWHQTFFLQTTITLSRDLIVTRTCRWRPLDGRGTQIGPTSPAVLLLFFLTPNLGHHFNSTFVHSVVLIDQLTSR